MQVGRCERRRTKAIAPPNLLSRSLRGVIPAHYILYTFVDRRAQPTWKNKIILIQRLKSTKSLKPTSQQDLPLVPNHAGKSNAYPYNLANRPSKALSPCFARAHQRTRCLHVPHIMACVLPCGARRGAELGLVSGTEVRTWCPGKGPLEELKCGSAIGLTY